MAVGVVQVQVQVQCLLMNVIVYMLHALYSVFTYFSVCTIL